MRKVIAGNIALASLNVAMAGQQSPSNLKQMVLSAYKGVKHANFDGGLSTFLRFAEWKQEVNDPLRRIAHKPGYLRYECAGKPSQSSVVWVTRCTYMPLNKAAAFCGMEAMWPPMIMLKGMRKHYPLIQLSDTVQVVEHYTPEQTEDL